MTKKKDGKLKIKYVVSYAGSDSAGCIRSSSAKIPPLFAA
jgi:hypothetical protein